MATPKPDAQLRRLQAQVAKRAAALAKGNEARSVALAKMLERQQAAAEERLANQRAAQDEMLAKQRAAQQVVFARQAEAAEAVQKEVKGAIAELRKFAGDGFDVGEPDPAPGPGPGPEPDPDPEPEPIDPDLPIDPVEPPPVEPPPAEAGWTYGDVGKNRHWPDGKGRVIRGEHFRSTVDLERHANTDFVDCTFEPADGRPFSERVAPNVRILGGVVRGVTVRREADRAPILVYWNMGHEPRFWGTVVQDLKVDDCHGAVLVETKGFIGLVLKGIRQLPNSGPFDQGIRIRHGENNQIIGCEGVRLVTLRCRGHVAEDCPDAVVVAFCGPLHDDYRIWKDQHPANKGEAWQRAAKCRIRGCRGAVVGFEQGRPDYPALDILLHEDMRGKVRLEPTPPDGKPRQVGTIWGTW